MDIRECEICGQQFVAGYGYSLAVNWLVTGSAYVPAHMCEEAGPSGQHWGCCPEHAVQAVERCLSEHMNVEKLMQKHTKAHSRKQEDGTVKLIHRYSPEDSAWAAGRAGKLGDNFHFVDLKL